MLSHGVRPPQSAQARPVLEVADIFRIHGNDYIKTHHLSIEQRKVLWAIQACRTPVLGGHLSKCQACGFIEVGYNSCRNRHCPKCQSGLAAQWVEQLEQRLLPIPYFHSVFTLPSELRPLALRNPEPIYSLLFATATKTLLELGQDPKRLGAQLGITAVLHTWSRDLSYHPHLHCLVTGGGLTPSHDRWVEAKGKGRFLFPVQALGVLFRGKFLAHLARLYQQGRLDTGGPCAHLAKPPAFEALVAQLYQTPWVVYTKRPFGSASHVLRYLGHYTHRVGLSNRRLVRMDSQGVCFKTRGGRTVTVAPHEFIRRFLLHVLPKGFVKIRHYGLHASSATQPLQTARTLLSQPSMSPCPSASPGSAHATMEVTPKADSRPRSGLDPETCPRCGHQGVRVYLRFPAARRQRRPVRLDSS